MNDPGAEPILTVRDGRVAWVIINRPDVMNALSTATNRALCRAIEDLDADESVGCIILRGAGDRAFSAGADLREVSGRSTEVLRAEFDEIVQSLRAIRNSRLPVIAAVKGFALGGGFGIVAAADMVVAAEDAVFATPEVGVGRFPLIISVGSLRGAHRNRVFEMAFTGRRVDAQFARDMGIVNQVVPSEEVWEAALSLGRSVARNPRSVLALGKRSLNAASDMPFDAALEYLREALVVNAAMEDSAEGVSAFLEKRTPRWLVDEAGA